MEGRAEETAALPVLVMVAADGEWWAADETDGMARVKYLTE